MRRGLARIQQQGASSESELALFQQVDQIQSDVRAEVREWSAALEQRRCDLKEFTVTLFGRTMAGKSTLMEIITEGDGASIGRGAQRTTRDVRSYPWRGLRVWDVPGVGAFEGEDDERIAFSKAGAADLILFLITDDAPQVREAEVMARLRELGRPILAVCNVKAAFHDELDRQLFLSDPGRFFDQERLLGVSGQFHDFVRQRIPQFSTRFVFVHLRSRFEATVASDPKQLERMVQASRFREFEKALLDEVVARGPFLRLKSFIDGACDPLRRLSNRLLHWSEDNSVGGRVRIEKQRELTRRLGAFERSSTAQIRALVEELTQQLSQVIPGLAEGDFDSSQIKDRWLSAIRELGVDEQAGRLQQEIHAEWIELSQAYSRAVTVSVERAVYLDSLGRMKLEGTYDWGQAFGWVSSIGALLRLIPSPITKIVGLVMSLFGGIAKSMMGDHQEEMAQRRAQVSFHLQEQQHRLARQWKSSLEQWFRLLMEGEVRDYQAAVQREIQVVFEMADHQRSLAWDLLDELCSLNQRLIEASLRHLGMEEQLSSIRAVARVPGRAVMLLIDRDVQMPREVRIRLSRLLGESLWYVKDTGSRQSILRQAIGRDASGSHVRIEDKIKVAHLRLPDLDETGRVRVELAQQLTRLQVSIDRKESA